MLSKRHFIPTVFCLLFLFLFDSGLAQSLIDDEQAALVKSNGAQLWAEAIPEFQSNEVPAKWSNESAVILGYKRYLKFDREGRFMSRRKNLVITEKKRFKIKLLDINAVKEFSTLYFRSGEDEDGFDVRIVKADGRLETIPFDKAIELEREDKVPDFFLGFFEASGKALNYFKLPVAGLEKDDILEFASFTLNEIDVTSVNNSMSYTNSISYSRASIYNFGDKYELCSKSYPIRYNEIAIESDNKTYLTSRSLNGAPEFKISKTEDGSLYAWIDRNRDRVRDVNYINEYIETPMLKYSLIYASNFNPKKLFVGEAGQLKQKFSYAEVAERGKGIFLPLRENTMLSPWGSQVFANQFDRKFGERYNGLSSKDLKEMDDDTYVKTWYYSLRFSLYEFMEGGPKLSPLHALYLFADRLADRDLSYRVLVTSPNNLSRLSDLISENELQFVVQYKDWYLTFANRFGLHSEVLSHMQGAEAVAIPFNSKQELKVITFPEHQPADNQQKEDIRVILDITRGKYQIAKKFEVKGMAKHKVTEPILENTMLDEINGLCPELYGEGFIPKYWGPQSGKAAWREEQRDKLRNNMKRYFEYQLKKQEESNYSDSISLKSAKITHTGACPNSDFGKYEAEFEVAADIRKAGTKWLINLPALIGGQLHLTGSERERQLDADMRYARTLSWNIRFKIPTGYRVAGFENLRDKVESAAAAFSCEAKQENDELLISVTKIYKQRIVKKEQWPDFLKFTDAAYGLSQKWILLEPVK